MTASTTHVPDLLRRFVPTPFSAMTNFCGTNVTLQTNDSALLSKLMESDSPVQPKAKSVCVTVVSDQDAPTDDAEVRVFSAGAIRTVFAGAGTMLIVDAERTEVFGFLAPNVLPELFVRELLPLALELLGQVDREQL